MRTMLTSFAIILAFFCYEASAQDRQITGKVTSGQDGNALVGVTILVKGTVVGTYSKSGSVSN